MMPFRAPAQGAQAAPPLRFFCREPWKIVLLTVFTSTGVLFLFGTALFTAATGTLACERRSGSVVCTATVALIGVAWEEEPPFTVRTAEVVTQVSRRTGGTTDALVLCDRGACVNLSGVGPRGTDAAAAAAVLGSMVRDPRAPARASWEVHLHSWSAAGLLFALGAGFALVTPAAFRRRIVALGREGQSIQITRRSAWPFPARTEEVPLGEVEAAEVVEHRSYRDHRVSVVLVVEGRRLDLDLSYSSVRRARALADALETALRSWRGAVVSP